VRPNPGWLTFDTHLSDFQKVVLRRNPHSLDRNAAPHVRSGPDVCESTGGKQRVRNLYLSRYHHAVWQYPVALSESPQGNEESLLLGGFEDVTGYALTRPSEWLRVEFEPFLTWYKILTHDTASLPSKREIKTRPSFSATTPANAWMAWDSSVALVIPVHICW